VNSGSGKATVDSSGKKRAICQLRLSFRRRDRQRDSAPTAASTADGGVHRRGRPPPAANASATCASAGGFTQFVAARWLAGSAPRPGSRPPRRTAATRRCRTAPSCGPTAKDDGVLGRRPRSQQPVVAVQVATASGSSGAGESEQNRRQTSPEGHLHVDGQGTTGACWVRLSRTSVQH
jgi:hypothetical protein